MVLQARPGVPQLAICCTGVALPIAVATLLHKQYAYNYAWNPLENASTQERLISALRYKLRYPDRVCSIAIRGPYQYEIIEALDLPLPALECLEIDDTTSVGHTYLPMSMSLMTSIQSLRHVRLAGKPLTSFFPILSVTRAIIDLTLNIDTVLCSAKGASLLTHLQYMPQLRNLQVETQSLSSEEMEGEEMEGEEMPSIMSILLAELTYVRFRGECAEIEWIMAGLVTPSLREFHITAYDDGTLHIPYLFEFIRVADIVVSTARLSISRFGFAITLFAHPHSIEDLTFKIVTVTTPFLANPSGAPSAMLGTIEDIFFSLGDNMTHHELLLEDLVSWREFFEEFRNVKVLRLCHCLDTQVVDILRLLPMNSPPSREGVDPDAITPLSTPINSNGSQSLGIFPLLEEIVVYATKSDTRIDEKERASVLESFVPFTTARHEAGRPVKVFWNTDGVFPRCFRM
ncbi:hypothetical protein DFH94DRAFT_481290 [Russula ochroleuca]|uniref:Uncharacterized protein n=1 Tax=Russula ochroleuca TaxID=152965 RepID=A0A9P5T9W2_9AGAM|nr:hypothetical protein DFH94DRAFT_481290 [Russula ochroleuca]